MKRVKAIFLSVLIILNLCTYGASAKSAQTFSDVPPSHWAYSYIEQAVEKGYVDGVGGGKYDPDGSISNAQFIAMLVKAFMRDTLPQDGSNQSGWSQWWGPYVQATLGTGLLNGMTLGEAYYKDGPKALAAIAELPISRYDMAEAIAGMMRHLHVESPSSTVMARTRASIPDYSSIRPTEHWIAVDYAYASGCLTGIDSKGTFAGDSGMTRAQAAVVLIRLDELNTTGKISETEDTSIVPQNAGDMTQGYWLLYDPNPDRMEVYRFYSDGTFEYTYQYPSMSLNRGRYELHDKILNMHYSSDDREYTYNVVEQCWTRSTTKHGVDWTDVLTYSPTCNDFFRAPEWIQGNATGEDINYEVIYRTNYYKSVDDVDIVLEPYFDPQYAVYHFYEIRTTPSASLICSFALPEPKLINYQEDISVLFQSDEYLVIHIWHDFEAYTQLSYDKKNGALKILPSHYFTYPVNNSLLLGYDFVADASFPNSMALYTMTGEHVCDLVTDKYLLIHAIIDTHIYYAYSETDPGEHDQNLCKVWRYDLATGRQEEIYSLVCREIEELGPGYIKYKESWTGPTLTLTY